MGREKEARIIGEEIAQRRARDAGDVCMCTRPLLTAKERSTRTCSYCAEQFAKDD